MAVKIIDYKVKQTKDGKEFVVLQAQGAPEIVQSSQTGKFYMTTKKCTIPTTFSEDVAKTLLGTELPGKIVRMECDPFEWTDENTGEVILLCHRNTFVPEGMESPIPMTVE